MQIPLVHPYHIAQQHSTQHTMAKNAHDESDMFTTPGDTSISIDDECDDDCVMMTGFKRVTTTTTETTMTKRGKCVQGQRTQMKQLATPLDARHKRHNQQQRQQESKSTRTRKPGSGVSDVPQ